MYAGECGQHHGKGFLAFQHRYPWQFLSVLTGLVEPLHAVERTETGNLVPFVLTMQEQHQGVQAVIFPSGEVAGPLQRPFGEPRLVPIFLDAFDFLDHHLGKEVQRLILAVRSLRISLSITGHDCY